jgi:hypothetical protein
VTNEMSLGDDARERIFLDPLAAPLSLGRVDLWCGLPHPPPNLQRWLVHLHPVLRHGGRLDLDVNRWDSLRTGYWTVYRALVRAQYTVESRDLDGNRCNSLWVEAPSKIPDHLSWPVRCNNMYYLYLGRSLLQGICKYS